MRHRDVRGDIRGGPRERWGGPGGGGPMRGPGGGGGYGRGPPPQSDFYASGPGGMGLPFGDPYAGGGKPMAMVGTCRRSGSRSLTVK
jgi:hypothetical protein